MPAPTQISSASTAAAVANEFLALGILEPNFPPIDQMKLQKLLFYAHAWNLAFTGLPLFQEDIEAWPWGPVVKDVYYQTRCFGRGPIGGKISEIRQTGDGPTEVTFVEPAGVSTPALKTFIRSVWDTHKMFSGIQLSNSTHAAGEPWTIIKERYGGNLEHKPLIPNEVIESVFKKKLEDAATNTTTAQRSSTAG